MGRNIRPLKDWGTFVIYQKVGAASRRGPRWAAKFLTVTIVVMTCVLAIAILLLTAGTGQLTKEVGLIGVLALGPVFGGTVTIGIAYAIEYDSGRQTPVRRAVGTARDAETVVMSRIAADGTRVRDVRDDVAARGLESRNRARAGQSPRVATQRGSHRRLVGS